MTTAQIRPEADAVSEVGRPPRNWTAILLGVLAAVPVVSMIFEVARSPRMNYLDYWTVLGLASGPTGRFHFAGLFVVYNQHPVIIAGTLYWLDAKFFGAGNHPLGVLVIVLSLGIVVAMASMLPRTVGLTVRMATVAGFALLMFSPGNLENFVEGMSGTHWLSGLAPAVVAIALASRGRTVPALLLGVVACLGHGSAFPVWIALALVAWLRGDRRWKVLGPIGVGVLAAIGAGVALATLPGSSSVPSPMLSLDRILAVTAGVVGQLWSSQVPDISVLAGIITLVFLVVAVGLVVAARLRPAVDRPEQAAGAAGWAGLAVHSVVAAGLIGISRSGEADNIGEAGRYAVISALATCSLLALAVILWRRGAVLPIAVSVVTVGLVTFTVGSGQATNVRNQYPDQTVLAVAARLDAKNTMTSLRMLPSILPVLRGLGDYPFTSDFTLGCGGPELGGTLDLASVPVLAGPGRGASGGYVESGPVVGDTVLSGWAVVDGRRPDCVIVLDSENHIVGGGFVGTPRPDVATAMKIPDLGTGWHAVAAPGATKPQVVVLSGGRAYRLAVTPKP
jgi:hypothetical protein